ncbi:MAG TPA: thioesterase family protein [Ktedonobacterales bacterium]|nr:thioesterase family protein [Ktedonobacterales bacterium]
MRGRGGPVDPGSFQHWVRVDVRYSDLDTQGVVNNATYLTYFEHARVQFFERLRGEAGGNDGTDRQGGATGYTATDMPFVMARATCAYRHPITSLAPVHVGVRCTEAGRATIEMEYAICDRPEFGAVLYASGTTTAVCVDARTGKPRSLPEWARRALGRPPDAPTEPGRRGLI